MEVVFQFYHFFYSMAVVYTDLLRRAAETHGPDSPGMLRALRDIDDVLQAKLKDIKAKADHNSLFLESRSVLLGCVVVWLPICCDS